MEPRSLPTSGFLPDYYSWMIATRMANGWLFTSWFPQLTFWQPSIWWEQRWLPIDSSLNHSNKKTQFLDSISHWNVPRIFHVYSTYISQTISCFGSRWSLKAPAKVTTKDGFHSYVTGCHRIDVILLMKSPAKIPGHPGKKSPWKSLFKSSKIPHEIPQSNGFVYPPLKIFPKLLRFRKGLRGMSNDADVDAALEQVAAVLETGTPGHLVVQ